MEALVQITLSFTSSFLQRHQRSFFYCAHLQTSCALNFLGEYVFRAFQENLTKGSFRPQLAKSLYASHDTSIVTLTNVDCPTRMMEVHWLYSQVNRPWINYEHCAHLCRVLYATLSWDFSSKWRNSFVGEAARTAAVKKPPPKIKAPQESKIKD